MTRVQHSPEEMAEAVMRELAAEPAGEISLPRLAKRLGASASQLMRVCTWLGKAGPGWVSLGQGTDARGQPRWLLRLTETGKRQAAAAGSS